jgi:hypothetical protein
LERDLNTQEEGIDRVEGVLRIGGKAEVDPIETKEGVGRTSKVRLVQIILEGIAKGLEVE